MNYAIRSVKKNSFHSLKSNLAQQIEKILNKKMKIIDRAKKKVSSVIVFQN